MMLKAQPGSTCTAAGRAPAGASQRWNAAPAAESSSATRGTAMRSPTCATVCAAEASRKKSLASASAIMPASSSPVQEGASGATTTPARSAPR